MEVANRSPIPAWTVFIYFTQIACFRVRTNPYLLMHKVGNKEKKQVQRANYYTCV